MQLVDLSRNCFACCHWQYSLLVVTNSAEYVCKVRFDSVRISKGWVDTTVQWKSYI